MKKKINCPECNELIEEGVGECIHCGVELSWDSQEQDTQPQYETIERDELSKKKINNKKKYQV